jgi:hypothetical protein
MVARMLNNDDLSPIRKVAVSLSLQLKGYCTWHQLYTVLKPHLITDLKHFNSEIWTLNLPLPAILEFYFITLGDFLYIKLADVNGLSIKYRAMVHGIRHWRKKQFCTRCRKLHCGGSSRKFSSHSAYLVLLGGTVGCRAAALYVSARFGKLLY